MKRHFIIPLLLFALIFITSCRSHGVYLEDTTISLSVGMDLDKNNNLVLYQISPVFSEDAQSKHDVLSVANVLNARQARDALNASSSGYVVGGKIQVFLLGKKLLSAEPAMNYLDNFYRDPKPAINVILVAVDGPVADIMNFSPQSNGRLSVYLKELIETANRNRITVKTELDDFFSQTYNKGITPYITEIRKGEEEILITGATLLKNDGTYATSLNKDQTSLLMILQGDVDQPTNLSIKLTENDSIGFTIQKVRRKVTSNYVDGKFYFDISLEMMVNFLELSSGTNASKDIKELENIAEERLQERFNELIAIIQEHTIDPIGLGNYARAYHYQQWKQVKNHWGEALAEAEISVTPKVTLKSFGIIK